MKNGSSTSRPAARQCEPMESFKWMAGDILKTEMENNGFSSLIYKNRDSYHLFFPTGNGGKNKKFTPLRLDGKDSIFSP